MAGVGAAAGAGSPGRMSLIVTACVSICAGGGGSNERFSRVQAGSTSAQMLSAVAAPSILAINLMPCLLAHHRRAALHTDQASDRYPRAAFAVSVQDDRATPGRLDERRWKYRRQKEGMADQSAVKQERLLKEPGSASQSIRPAAPKQSRGLCHFSQQPQQFAPADSAPNNRH